MLVTMPYPKCIYTIRFKKIKNKIQMQPKSGNNIKLIN